MKKNILILIVTTMLSAVTISAGAKINRKAVVQRNNPCITYPDPLASLSVGNGKFAATVDVTGLQTFPEAYSKGVPLCTMSQWGWHSFPKPNGIKEEDSWREYDFGRGHKEIYATQPKDGSGAVAVNWYRANPHRLHLGSLGLNLDCDLAAINGINQTLDMWSGKITSNFCVNNKKYNVETVCYPERDMIATRVKANTAVALRLKFPYPTGGHCDDASDWQSDSRHTTEVVQSGKQWAVLKRSIDATVYYVTLHWQGKATLKKKGANLFVLAGNGKELSATCEYTEEKPQELLNSAQTSCGYEQAEQFSANFWQRYWETGAIVDFSECTDKRAAELERRVVLSQYLLAIQEAGDTPPQETGLTYNSWYGKFHLEMILWHQAQFPLWGHHELLDRSLSWYFKAENNARKIAQRQGFKGVRWMKMTDPWVGEAPSKVGSFLIWQQPHLIYLAELLYRANPSPAVLQKYDRLVEETAEFMADFAQYDTLNHRYILGGCIAAQETLPAKTTVNPPMELSYWHCALSMAQAWRERMGKPRVALWDDIIEHISPLAHKDSLYLAAETQPDTYSNESMYSDHPAVTGAVGLLPLNPKQVDTDIMKNTEQWIWNNWKWETSWGWDYPMMAMCAARMGEPDNAVGALLMKQTKNTYLPNGHNYQSERLRLYMPGNGALLLAVGMMCAGWDGATQPNPGFPHDGKWNVKWEGLKVMP